MTKKCEPKNIYQQGYTLIEIMLVLVLIIVIVAMSMKYYLTANMNGDVLYVMRDLQKISIYAERYANSNTTSPGGYTGFSMSDIPDPPTWGAMSISASTVNSYTIAVISNSGQFLQGGLCNKLETFLENNHSQWTITGCSTSGSFMNQAGHTYLQYTK